MVRNYVTTVYLCLLCVLVFFLTELAFVCDLQRDFYTIHAHIVAFFYFWSLERF